MVWIGNLIQYIWCKESFNFLAKYFLHMKLEGVVPLVADPPQRNSTNRRNPPNRVKLLPYSVTISNLITTLFVQQAVFDYLYNLLLVSKQVPGVKSQHVSPGKNVFCFHQPAT